MSVKSISQFDFENGFKRSIEDSLLAQRCKCDKARIFQLKSEDKLFAAVHNLLVQNAGKILSHFKPSSISRTISALDLQIPQKQDLRIVSARAYLIHPHLTPEQVAYYIAQKHLFRPKNVQDSLTFLGSYGFVYRETEDGTAEIYRTFGPSGHPGAFKLPLKCRQLGSGKTAPLLLSKTKSAKNPILKQIESIHNLFKRLPKLRSVERPPSKVFDFGQACGVIPSQNLSTDLIDLINEGGLTPKRSLQVGENLLTATLEAWIGAGARLLDIKPDNIRMDDEGNFFVSDVSYILSEYFPGPDTSENDPIKVVGGPGTPEYFPEGLYGMMLTGIREQNKELYHRAHELWQLFSVTTTIWCAVVGRSPYKTKEVKWRDPILDNGILGKEDFYKALGFTPNTEEACINLLQNKAYLGDEIPDSVQKLQNLLESCTLLKNNSNADLIYIRIRNLLKRVQLDLSTLEDKWTHTAQIRSDIAYLREEFPENSAIEQEFQRVLQEGHSYTRDQERINSILAMLLVEFNVLSTDNLRREITSLRHSQDQESLFWLELIQRLDMPYQQKGKRRKLLDSHSRA